MARNWSTRRQTGLTWVNARRRNGVQFPPSTYPARSSTRAFGERLHVVIPDITGDAEEVAKLASGAAADCDEF